MHQPRAERPEGDEPLNGIMPARSTHPSLGEIHGLGAAAGMGRGIARVITSPTDLDDVPHGTILVCTALPKQWQRIARNVRGIVTEAGGVLSNPAIVAREHRCPLVVSADSATRRIRQGDLLEVDGTAGIVRVVT